MKRPTYKLKTLNKLTDERGNDIGAGWLNADWSITLKLRPSIALVQQDDCVITLFPTANNLNLGTGIAIPNPAQESK